MGVDPLAVGTWMAGLLERSPVIAIAVFSLIGNVVQAVLNSRIRDQRDQEKEARLKALQTQLEAKDKDTRILEQIAHRDATLEARMDMLVDFLNPQAGRRRRGADEQRRPE